MLVKDLLKILEKQDPEAEVVLKRYDSTGYDILDVVIPGNFKITDYGNDFFEYDFSEILSEECKAVCLEGFILEESIDKLEELKKSKPRKLS